MKMIRAYPNVSAVLAGAIDSTKATQSGPTSQSPKPSIEITFKSVRTLLGVSPNER
jgi:hypothetical protein